MRSAAGEQVRGRRFHSHRFLATAASSRDQRVHRDLRMLAKITHSLTFEDHVEHPLRKGRGSDVGAPHLLQSVFSLQRLAFIQLASRRSAGSPHRPASAVRPYGRLRTPWGIRGCVATAVRRPFVACSKGSPNTVRSVMVRPLFGARLRASRSDARAARSFRRRFDWRPRGFPSRRQKPSW
jgi:hypothetical protein